MFFQRGGNNSIGTIRNLGARKIPVLTIDTGIITANSLSRFCRVKKAPDPIKHEEDFIACLEDLGRSAAAPPVLFPMDDLGLLLLVNHRSRLEPYFHYHFMDRDVFEKCVNKRKMYESSIKAGLPTPATHDPVDEKELKGMIGNIRFPCVVKPAGKFELHGDAAEEYFSFYHRYGNKALQADSAESLMDLYRELTKMGIRPLIQELIPGDMTRLYTYAFYIDPSGEVRADFVGRKIRQRPMDFGTVTVGESLDNEEVRELGIRFLHEVGFAGIGNIEFKLDPRTGKFFLMEINARTGSFISLPTASGVNITHIAYCALTGRPYDIPTKQKDHVLWVDLLRDTIGYYQARKEGLVRSRRQWKLPEHVKKNIRHIRLEGSTTFFDIAVSISPVRSLNLSLAILWNSSSSFCCNISNY